MSGATVTREPRASRWRDVVEGFEGVTIMAGCFLTPFLRASRRSWGVGTDVASRALPGDDLVPHPRWEWTHGIEVDAPAQAVWPWVAQIGADRAGFYSYELLENLVGCRVRNAERVHPEWSSPAADGLLLHPKVPRLPMAHVEEGRCFVVHAAPETDAEPTGARWTNVSWSFLVEARDPDHCLVISRYRCATSDDVVTRLQFGPTMIEPIGFAMDRRMLRGIKERAERARRG